MGKFLDLDLERDRVVVNPMLTGRFQLAGLPMKPVRDRGGAGVRAADGRAARDAATWTTGAAWMPGG